MTHFQLLHNGEVVFPRARLSAIVPEEAEGLQLQVIIGHEAPPSIRVVVGKASTTEIPGTSPLYKMCELQTPMLGNTENILLRDVMLRRPQGTIAAKVLERYHHIVKAPKLGKRHLSEFKKDLEAPDRILHIPVSSDGETLALRAKMVHDPAYVIVPVLESEGASPPWNKKQFSEVRHAIYHAY